MTDSVARLVLWLFVINLGIAFGAGLYESRIVVPQWLSYSPDAGYRWNAEAAREANTGLKFWVFVSTVPLTLLTLANLIAGWRAQGALRAWWLGSALAAAADRVFTFSYFIPTMITLMRPADLSDSEAVAMATQWGHLNHVRHALIFAAWLAALQAFSLVYAPRSPGRRPGTTST